MKNAYYRLRAVLVVLGLLVLFAVLTLAGLGLVVFVSVGLAGLAILLAVWLAVWLVYYLLK